MVDDEDPEKEEEEEEEEPPSKRRDEYQLELSRRNRAELEARIRRTKAGDRWVKKVKQIHKREEQESDSGEDTPST